MSTHDSRRQDAGYHRQVQLTLLATCEEMLLLAGKGEWSRVAELEVRRSRELTEYLSLPMLESDAPGLREVIEKIAGQNERLVVMASEARDNASAQLGHVRKGARASLAYLSSQGNR